jgi:Raf kinase inhibitor-like YbhB/YbcL family protein
MKRLLHLLWIIPALLIAGVSTLAVLAGIARDRDAEYHESLKSSIQVRSRDFQHLQEIPDRFSCSGEGISPQIEWSDGPDGTRSYALVASDWDAPSPGMPLFTVAHWVLYNIPASMRAIAQDIGTSRLGDLHVVVGSAMGGTVGYLPPCPPLGRHQYQFRVYALDVDTVSPESDSRSDILAAIESHVLAYGELIGFRTAR